MGSSGGLSISFIQTPFLSVWEFAFSFFSRIVCLSFISMCVSHETRYRAKDQQLKLGNQIVVAYLVFIFINLVKAIFDKSADREPTRMWCALCNVVSFGVCTFLYEKCKQTQCFETLMQTYFGFPIRSGRWSFQFELQQCNFQQSKCNTQPHVYVCAVHTLIVKMRNSLE